MYCVHFVFAAKAVDIFNRAAEVNYCLNTTRAVQQAMDEEHCVQVKAGLWNRGAEEAKTRTMSTCA